MTDKCQWSLLFSFADMLFVLNSAGQNFRHGLSSLPDISRSLPDMSGMLGIFRDHGSFALSADSDWPTHTPSIYTNARRKFQFPFFLCDVEFAQLSFQVPKPLIVDVGDLSSVEHCKKQLVANTFSHCLWISTLRIPAILKAQSLPVFNILSYISIHTPSLSPPVQVQIWLYFSHLWTLRFFIHHVLKILPSCTAGIFKDVHAI